MKYQISNIKYLRNIFAFCFVIFIFAFSSLSFVNAQQVTLSLDPPIVQTKIKPGKSILVAYTVENTGDPTNLQFLIRPFTPIGQQGSLTVERQLEGPIQFNLENADVVLEKPFFFASKEKRQAVIRIHVPLGIPDGDYYYSLLAEATPPTASEGIGSARVKTTIGSNILVTISNSGNIDIKPKVATFSTRGGFSLGKNIKLFDSSDKI
ncbi:MAG: hypothetical protein WCW14_04835, partial [Candidatus Paceibacterota bacterium]